MMKGKKTAKLVGYYGHNTNSWSNQIIDELRK